MNHWLELLQLKPKLPVSNVNIDCNYHDFNNIACTSVNINRYERELFQSRARIERVFIGSSIIRSLEILKIQNLRWKISFVSFVS